MFLSIVTFVAFALKTLCIASIMFLVVILIYSAELLVGNTFFDSFDENKAFLTEWVDFYTFILSMVKHFIIVTLYWDYFWGILCLLWHGTLRSITFFLTSFIQRCLIWSCSLIISRCGLRSRRCRCFVWYLVYLICRSYGSCSRWGWTKSSIKCSVDENSISSGEVLDTVEAWFSEITIFTCLQVIICFPCKFIHIVNGTLYFGLVSTFRRTLFYIENNFDFFFLQNFVEFIDAWAVLVKFKCKVSEFAFILRRNQLLDLIKIPLQFSKLWLEGRIASYLCWCVNLMIALVCIQMGSMYY